MKFLYKILFIFALLLIISTSQTSAIIKWFDNTDANFKNVTNVSILQGNTLIGNLSWGNITAFPSACPANTALTALGMAVTCTDVSGFSNFSASYVPYVGANRNVDLGINNLTLHELVINRSISGISGFGVSNLGSYQFGFINFSGFNNSVVVQNGTYGQFIHIGANLVSTGQNSTITIRNTASSSTAPNYLIGTIRVISGNSMYANFGSGSQGYFTGGVINIGGGPNYTATIGSESSSATGSFVWGAISSTLGTTNVNATIGASGQGSFAQGFTDKGKIESGLNSGQQGSFAQGAVTNTNGRISAFGAGAFAQGSVSGINAQILSGIGSFGQGFIQGARSNISALGQGSFTHGFISSSNPDNYIKALGDGSVAIGLPNITCISTGSICLGQNINITGINSLGVGLGSVTTQVISQARVFSVMTGAVGINSTGPQYALEVNGGAKAFNVSNFLFANGTHVGIGQSNPTYPLEVGVNYSGISAWFQGNISVDDVIFRSKVFDTTKGSALKYVKNASAYKFQNGTINHSAFEYSKVTYANRRITGYHTVQVDKEICAPVKKQVEIETYDENGLVNGTTTEEQDVVECPVKKVPEVQPIYQNYQEEGYSLEDEVAVLRQSVYELKLQNEQLETRLNNIAALQVII